MEDAEDSDPQELPIHLKVKAASGAGSLGEGVVMNRVGDEVSEEDIEVEQTS